MPGLDTTTTETQTANRGGEVEGIDELLEDAQRGEFDALHQAIVRYERTLDAALDADDGGSRHREVFWTYYEPLANMLDRATQTEGWAFLHDVVHAHHPQADNDLPLAAPPIENAVGRFLIRTRFTDGVEEIPVDGLEYLVAIPAYATQGADIAREESHTYGWGIGHPDHSIVDRLRQWIEDDPIWVNATLEYAFYADQYAAVDVSERLLTDDTISKTAIPYGGGTIDVDRLVVDCVAGVNNDRYWPQLPRYWDWQKEFDYTFDWNPDVRKRIRSLVQDTGIADDLSDEWMFQDLAL